MTKQMKRQSISSTSASSDQPHPTEGQINLNHYLTKLSLPSGLQSAVSSIYSSLESRIWILDNSAEMQADDGCLVLADDSLRCISREGGVSRWSEAIQCSEFHRKMGARCWIPTKFWMTNKPNNESQRFGICWGTTTTNWTSEKERTAAILTNLAPHHDANPLACEIRKIARGLAPEAQRLRRENKFVSVVVCTQGVPTDAAGENTPEVMKECISSLFELSDLPVRIVFRLCTSDGGVLEFYKKVDLDIECDVLGDYWNEAKEVHQHNPWLTYGIGLHRIREGGLGTEMMDLIDERPLTLDEMYEWCMNTFVGNNFLSMRDPTEDWYGFVSDLQVFLMDESDVFNPIKNTTTPWIDVEALNRIYEPYTNKGARPKIMRKSSLEACVSRSTSFHERAEMKKKSMARRGTFTSVQDVQASYRRASSNSSEEKVDTDLASSSDDSKKQVNSSGNARQRASESAKGQSINSSPKESRPRRRVTVSFVQESMSINFTPFEGNNAYAKNHLRKLVSGYHPSHYPNQYKSSSPEVVSPRNKPKNIRQSFAGTAAPPLPTNTHPRRTSNPKRSQSFHVSKDPPPSSGPNNFKPRTIPPPPPQRPSKNIPYNPLKSSAIIKLELSESLFGMANDKTTDTSLELLIKKWSHDKAGKLRPLQMLLFEVPVLLPPNNVLVENHEYFTKWKTVHRHEFPGCEEDDQVVCKLVKKCKLFLHPDKWPRDLNEDQKLLLQVMWDVFQESALF